MQYKILAVMVMMLILAGVSYAADDQASLGAQAGTAARELKGTAAESYAAASIKTAETAKKMQDEAQETLKNLQQQWDVLAKQLQEKTQQLQKQLQAQWQDFNKSFNKQQ